MDKFSHLLQDGERVEKLNLSGWVVLDNLLQPGDTIIVDRCDLLDRPIRATVEVISPINTVKIDIQTEGAKDRTGAVWPTGYHPYYMDVMWHIYKIVRG